MTAVTEQLFMCQMFMCVLPPGVKSSTKSRLCSGRVSGEKWNEILERPYASQEGAVDALKKRRRALKKRGRVLKKRGGFFKRAV